MEAIVEPKVHSAVDSANVNVVSEGFAEGSQEANPSHKTNGVVGASDAGYSITVASAPASASLETIAPVPESENVFFEGDTSDTPSANENNVAAASYPSEAEGLEAMETRTAVANLLSGTNPSQVPSIITDIVVNSENICHESEVTVEQSTFGYETTCKDKVTFQTEIVVEKHDSEISHDQLDNVTDEPDNTNSILNDLGQGIELSDALRSSDTSENAENNNSGKQEVFNKEELLDILEGNDVETSGNSVTALLDSKDLDSIKAREAQIAIKQLSRLKKHSRTKTKGMERPRKRGRTNKNTSNTHEKEKNNIENESDNTTEQSGITEEVTDGAKENFDTSSVKDSENIVNVLVKDWDDDEPEIDQPSKVSGDGSKLLTISDQLEKSLETVTNQEEVLDRTSVDSPSCEGQNISSNKIGDDGQPQRRLGRVIKKKVIFDPDNPDTFTKGKVLTKHKELHAEKEASPKKTKTDEKQRSKSKSPMSKMAWKKPPPKNISKQNKRLTEVDRLLMDEGAVNMIYQLTPEAPKGKKNMKTKAEFIKKIQSSTPDGKEMKFRERKVAKSEEEAKKILGGKQRSSLSGSVKSPSVCEDFETHSADDSIIYRRHSSSSYSSTCMSPRRLSDVDAGAVQTAARASRQPSESQNQINETENVVLGPDIFTTNAVDTSNQEIINKDDCMSIKQKLNTKLSLALNKRKRESTKGEKPPKQKKVSKAESKDSVKVEKISFKHLSVNFDHRLAEICIGKTGSKANVEVLKELGEALASVENRQDISVTLLTSECETLCSDLDLQLLLDNDPQSRTNYANEITESVRSLLCALWQHSKLVVSGVRGATRGVGLAVLALSDVVLASESATFATGAGLPLPGVAALTARCPQPLLNEMVVFGRCVPAAEALRVGLVSRTLWPEGAAEQVRAIAKDLAAQPMQSLLLKKQLLRLKKSADSETTFLSNLEKERDLLVQYWTSVEGQEVLRSTYNVA